jgi:hypothetical protein
MAHFAGIESPWKVYIKGEVVFDPAASCDRS